jgi:hypothetical protein
MELIRNQLKLAIISKHGSKWLELCNAEQKFAWMGSS